MTAEQMFKDLNYNLTKKTDKTIEYKTNDYPPFDRVSFSITLKSYNTTGKTGQNNPSNGSVYLPLAKAIIQQMKELGWVK
jgi:hypothetical protein